LPLRVRHDSDCRRAHAGHATSTPSAQRFD
jgi:hypothetical protein